MKFGDLFDTYGAPKDAPLATFFCFNREPETLCMAVSGRRFMTIASSSPTRQRANLGSANLELKVIEQFPVIEWRNT